MKKLMVPALLILALVLVVGCSKAPAQAALTAADEAIAKVKPEAEKYVPQQFADLTKAAADAKAKFDAGNYAEALAAAKDLPGKANDVMTAAKAKKDELTKQWTDMQGSMPGLIQGLTAKVGELAAMKKLPVGLDKAKLDSAKASLTDATAGWTAAADAFKAGDVTGALAKAGDVKTKVEELTKSLGPAPAAAKM